MTDHSRLPSERRAEPFRSETRTIGLAGNVALAFGGTNQSLVLLAILFAGQENVPGYGSFAVPIMIAGFLLSCAAVPGWTELVLMSPNRVGGIAAACSDAFRPYSPILSALAGCCYWFGWAPACGATALLLSNVVQAWLLPAASTNLMACGLVAAVTVLNLCGISRTARAAIPVALVAATLSLLAVLVPVVSGSVDWSRAVDFRIHPHFEGGFGLLTEVMAGLYLIGYGAPAMEAATCQVGAVRDPERTIPRSMVINAGVAGFFYVVLPVVWLGALGPAVLRHDLGTAFGPVLVPLFGGFAKSAIVGLIAFNMLSSTAQGVAGPARTLSQLADDGLLPRALSRRLRDGTPWCAVLATALMAMASVLSKDPVWFLAATNFTYLIGICLPSVAVWLLRRDAPERERPFRAPAWTIRAGLVAAGAWGCAVLFGFQQFGLPTVALGLLMAHAGAFLYGWRRLEDRRRLGLRGVGRSLHLKLTGAMMIVLGLDTAGYMLAFLAVPARSGPYPTILADVFVLVALLTLTIGLVLPGMIAESAEQMRLAAQRLAGGTVSEFVDAMQALGEGRLDDAHASVDIVPVPVRSDDEIGAMAASFNAMQVGVRQAAVGLVAAREGLRRSRADLEASNASLAQALDQQRALSEEILLAKENAIRDSLHDALTGLPNRRFFLGELRRTLAGTTPPDGFAVLFLDLDRFKLVNDGLGHLAGDDLLVQVARRLEAALTSSPHAVQNEGLLARFGGDEFTVLLRGPRHEGDLNLAAETLLLALGEPFAIAGQDTYVGASLGATLGPADYASAEDMLRDADTALYRAKTNGRGRICVFQPAMHSTARHRLELDAGLHRALADDEFEVHYQPLVCLREGRILGFEALVRWRHPTKGMIPPGNFIPLAEETGFIGQLGRHVLARACRDVTTLNGALPPGRKVYVSVNLSPIQLAQSHVVSEVRAVLAETGAEPASVKLEITESGTVGDLDRTARVLGQLKALGVSLSVDDFGTGHSSLGYVHALPFDVLKIDQSFVRGLPGHTGSHRIVDTILRLAGGLGLDVVAEGIETAEQAEVLARLGCAVGQGYLFARPLPFDEARALLDVGFAVRQFSDRWNGGPRTAEVASMANVG